MSSNQTQQITVTHLRWRTMGPWCEEITPEEGDK
jgi:hypothetical protein